jgi:hypothetical protein
MLNEQNLRFVREAVTEWKRLSKGREWQGWMKIAAALDLGSREVMHDVGTNKREGGAYNRAFSAWCRDQGFRNPEIEPPTRSHMLFLMEPENRLICEELRAAMTQQERLRISHPDSMYKRVRAYLKKRDEATRPKKPTVDEKIRELESQQAHLDELLASADIDPDAVALQWFQRKSPEGMARLFTGLDRGKAEKLAAAITAWLADAAAFEEEEQ